MWAGATPWYAVLKQRATPEGECSRMNGQDVYLVKRMVEWHQRAIRQEFAEANVQGGPTVASLVQKVITAFLATLLGR